MPLRFIPRNVADVEGATGQWQLLEMHYEASVLKETFVDATKVGSDAEASGVAVDKFRVGQFLSPNDPDAIAYVDAVKLGTSRGGTEIFSDSFEGGDLSAWSSTFGSVSVVDDPGFAGGAGGKVLKADASADDAYVEKVLASSEAEVWLTLRVAWDAGADAFWAETDNVSGDFADLYADVRVMSTWVEAFAADDFPEPPGISYAFGHGAHESPRDWTRVDDPGQPSESGP